MNGRFRRANGGILNEPAVSESLRREIVHLVFRREHRHVSLDLCEPLVIHVKAIKANVNGRVGAGQAAERKAVNQADLPSTCDNTVSKSKAKAVIMKA